MPLMGWVRPLVLVLCAALIADAFATQSPQKEVEREASAQIVPTYSHPESRYNVPTADARANGGWVPDRASSARSVSVLDDRRRPPIGLQAAGQTSPGIVLCSGTTYDVQQNDDNQQMIALLGDPGGGYTHFVWTYWDRIPDSLDQIDRTVAYNCWSPGFGVGLGDCGYQFGSLLSDPLNARSGFPTIDVGSGDLSYVAFQARDEDSQAMDPPGPFSTYVFNSAAPCFSIWGEEEFLASKTAEAGWPHIRVDVGGSATKAPGDDVFHVCSHPSGDQPPFRNEIFYWRRVGGFNSTWQGPVVLDQNAGAFNYHVAVDPTSEKVAVFYERDDLSEERLVQVGYLQSLDNGANWIAAGSFPFPIAHDDYVFITNYLGPEGVEPQAWLECHGEYDFSGHKHCVWIEQIFSNQTADCRLMHWDEIHGIRTVKQALGWQNAGGDGGRDLWLALPNLGFGDGSTTCNDGPGDKTNRNYVYVTYEQYGGPTAAEQNDVSASGNQQNLDIYLAVSNDSGRTFSPSINLTNTKTPGCDGTISGQECASERDPSLAHIVNNTLHIMYILDTDAGDAVFGEGNWTFNPVMYLRIPGGTDSDTLCPQIAPVFAAQLSNHDPGCEYHAGLTVPPLEQWEGLTIQNFGNATLSGVVSENPPADWLNAPTYAYSISPDEVTWARSVVMDATAPSVTAEGLYQTQIEITHNDPSLASPYVIPVDFFVFDEFYCPEYVVMHTGWLWLNVSNVERQGNRTKMRGGLSRLNTDSSYSINDASLIIGVLPYEFDPDHPGLDTIVYRNIFGQGNGQPGFRALQHLIVDTSAYGTGTDYAVASARQTTVDSMLDIFVEYDFPQQADSSEFVLIKYTLWNRTESPVWHLYVGQATDFDVMPGVHDMDTLQIDAQNTGHYRSEFNLLYQQGADTAGHVIIGNLTATRFLAGITAIQCSYIPRGWIAPNDPWLVQAPGSGFSEDYLWTEMSKQGVEIFPPYKPNPEENLHTVIVFAQDVSLAPGEMKDFAMAYVSTNAGPSEGYLVNATKRAWKWAFGWNRFFDTSRVMNSTAHSLKVSAIGSHEFGLSSGSCGCVISKVSGAPEITVTDNGDCTGTVNFTGAVNAKFSAVIRVATPSSEYVEDRTVTFIAGTPPACACPHQGDLNADGFPDALDFNHLIDALFFGAPLITDPECPTSRGDLNNDGYPDALDLNYLINQLFFGGPPPVDPCNP